MSTTRKILAALTLLILGALILAPALLLLGEAATPAAWAAPDARQFALLARSLCIALGASGLAAIIALPCALCLFNAPPRVLAPAAALLSVPIFVPPYVLAIAWVDLLGAGGVFARLLGEARPTGSTFGFYSPAGVACVQALTWWPIVFLATVVALRRIPPETLDAARLHAPGARLVFRVLLPLARPGILLGMLAVAFLSWTSFAVPSLLQTNVYTVEIYTAFSLEYDPAHAFARAIPLAAMAVLFILGAALLLRRDAFLIQPFPDHRPTALFPRLTQFALWTAAAITGFGGVALPAGLLILRAAPYAELPASLMSAHEEILQSLALAFGAATIALPLALAAAFALPRAMRVPAALLALLPFLFTGPVWAIAMISLWNRPGLPGAIYDSPLILVLALAARYLWLALCGVLLLLAHRGKILEEAAALSGAPPATRFLQITLPLIAPQVFLLWAVIFTLAYGDLDSIVLLAPPGWAPLPLRLFTLMHYGPSREVAGLSLFALVSCLLWVVVAAVTAWAFRSRTGKSL